MAVQEDEGVRYVMAATHPLPEGRKGTYRNLYRTVHSIMFSGVGVSQENGPTHQRSQYGYGVTKSDLVDMILSSCPSSKSVSRGNLIRRFVDQSIQLGIPSKQRVLIPI
jgi:hypothetical protein